MKIKLIFSIAVLVLIFIFLYNRTQAPSSPNQVNSGKQDLKNLTYIVEGISVTLVNGISESTTSPGFSSKITTKYFGNEVSDDFDGDGNTDSAFLITQSNGGSGTFYYLVVALNKSGKLVGTNTILIGDRIAPQTTEFTDETIVVNYADRDPGAPMTSEPNNAISKYFKIENGKLIQV